MVRTMGLKTTVQVCTACTVVCVIVDNRSEFIKIKKSKKREKMKQTNKKKTENII